MNDQFTQFLTALANRLGGSGIRRDMSGVPIDQTPRTPQLSGLDYVQAGGPQAGMNRQDAIASRQANLDFGGQLGQLDPWMTFMANAVGQGQRQGQGQVNQQGGEPMFSGGTLPSEVDPNIGWNSTNVAPSVAPSVVPSVSASVVPAQVQASSQSAPIVSPGAASVPGPGFDLSQLGQSALQNTASGFQQFFDPMPGFGENIRPRVPIRSVPQKPRESVPQESVGGGVKSGGMNMSEFRDQAQVQSGNQVSDEGSSNAFSTFLRGIQSLINPFGALDTHPAQTLLSSQINPFNGQQQAGNLTSPSTGRNSEFEKVFAVEPFKDFPVSNGSNIPYAANASNVAPISYGPNAPPPSTLNPSIFSEIPSGTMQQVMGQTQPGSVQMGGMNLFGNQVQPGNGINESSSFLDFLANIPLNPNPYGQKLAPKYSTSFNPSTKFEDVFGVNSSTLNPSIFSGSESSSFLDFLRKIMAPMGSASAGQY